MKNHPHFSASLRHVFNSILVLLLCFMVFIGCSNESVVADPNINEPDPNTPNTSEPNTPEQNASNIDVNNDGNLNILIIGSSKSINNATNAFKISEITKELTNILNADASISLNITVQSEDIYTTKDVLVGLGQSGTEYTYTHFRHSLTQYYYWPEGRNARLQKLSGGGTKIWDYVVITADPYLVKNAPGYFALGVNKLASKIAEGPAKTLLVMMWPNDNSSTIEHFEETTYRTSENAGVTIQTVPAGLAWQALPSAKKDDSTTSYPSPNGAYLTAASIYAQIFNKSAASSDYTFDDGIADVAMNTVTSAASAQHFSGEVTFMSPFKACNIQDAVLNYNHTGTSSERGILDGLKWVVGKAGKTLVLNGDPPINFNYGRANTNFEPAKRYKIDSSQFDFSLGFPMQDQANHGELSMLYGIDQRANQSENGTDLGTAFYMVRNSELPYARAIPIRTLWAQLKEAIPDQSAYSDSWHMSGVLNKAIGGYMYTMLTNDCAVGAEPADQSSNEWRNWMAHKIGYQTAWILMNLEGKVPDCY